MDVQQDVQQDVAVTNPQSMNKFDNTKRRKPWEVFKRQPNEEDNVEHVVQYDSFRDKCSSNQMTGSGFTALLNGKNQQSQKTPTSNDSYKLNKNSYYQNLQKNKKIFNNGKGSVNNKQNDKEGQSQQGQRFNNSVTNNFHQKNNFRNNRSQNENTNSINISSNGQDESNDKRNRFTKFQTERRQNKPIENVGSSDELEGDQESPLSCSSSGEKKGGDKKQSASKNNRMTGASKRRQKICGSWVRVGDKQKLDKPPSYKDYLGALTMAVGKKPPQNKPAECGEEELYEVTNEMNAEAEEGELQAVADLEDGEIKLQEEDFFLKNQSDQRQQNAPHFSFQSKFNHSSGNGGNNYREKNAQQFKGKFSQGNPNKFLGQVRKESLQEEEENATSRKKVKIPTKDELIEQENELLQSGGAEQFNVLKKLDQLGNDMHKNRTGNNYQMQQTLAAQQDAFLNQYFNKQKGNNPQQPGAKRERKFDIKNYQVDLEKNMIEKNVTITEGLKNLAKIQNEMYTQSKMPKPIDLSGSGGSGGKLNRMLQQDSTEKELRDASKRLASNPYIKDLSSKLDFDSSKSFPGNHKNEKFQAALTQYEQTQSRLKGMSGKQQQQPNEEREEQGDNINPDEAYDNDDDDMNEFEKFNEEYLKKQEKMLEEIAKRNKEKVNEIKNARAPSDPQPIMRSSNAAPPSNVDSQKEEQMNPLERLIQEELERNRIDKQEQGYRLMELQKLQETQHVQNLQHYANSSKNMPPNYLQNKFNNQHQQQQQHLQQQANRKPSKFTDNPISTPIASSTETLVQLERLRQMTMQKPMNTPPFSFPIPPKPAGMMQLGIPPQSHQSLQPAPMPQITSLAQLQQQLFNNNSKQFLQTPQIPQMAAPSSLAGLIKPSGEEKPMQQNTEQFDQNPFSKEAVEEKIEIPEAIKNKQRHMKPALYEKVVNDYIRMQKQAKEESTSQKILDPRRRTRAVAQEDAPLESLPLPSAMDESEKGRSEMLSFCLDTHTMSTADSQSGQHGGVTGEESEVTADKSVYNYRLLKSEKNHITQEKNLIEKNITLSTHMESSMSNQMTQNVLQKDGEDSFAELFKSDRGDIRYFRENLAMHCFKCGQNGHQAKWCTTDTSEEKTQCLFCLGEHTKDYCTNYVCFKCYNVGHRIKDCAYDLTFDQMRCKQCRKKGHVLKNCGALNIDFVPKFFDFHSINLTHCIYCNKVGHINCFDPTIYLHYDGLYKVDQETLDKII